MAEPFLGEIKLVAFGFPPKGWAFCNGQLMAINVNQALFSLLGTTYGGDGRTNFALPDLRSRVPLHVSASFPLGVAGGESQHTLTVAEIPAHTHRATARAQGGDNPSPSGRAWGLQPAAQSYATAVSSPPAAMPAAQAAGGDQPHENRPPLLVLNFIIALQGIFPSRN
jgi:microcystin-dependent protein